MASVSILNSAMVISCTRSKVNVSVYREMKFLYSVLILMILTYHPLKSQILRAIFAREGFRCTEKGGHS